MFNVDFIQLANSWLPWFIRKPKMKAWIIVLLKPLIWLYLIFYAVRKRILFKLYHNGQVIYIEHLLNAVFNNNAPAYIDGIPNGIYIGDGQIFENRPYIYAKSENSEEENRVMAKSESEPDITEYPPIILYTKSEFSLMNWDFSINVPIAIGDVGTFPNYTQLGQLIQAWANIYLPAGSTYRINNY
jgi:hypothetical protein